MAKPAERMRLKDKIIDDVSKAIKSIQEKVYHLSKDPSFNGDLILSNGDRLCHKLCDKLDHAFLHGLKDVTHGYWKLFKAISHKGMVKEIELLTNVTTDLGRGRAWLYASLNESLLESYVRLLDDNEKLVKKHYNKDALVMDCDRMNVLLTLTSGLDCVMFQLEYDLPYLDLSPSPPQTQISVPDEETSSQSENKLPSKSSAQSDSHQAPVTETNSDKLFEIQACQEQTLNNTPSPRITPSSDNDDMQSSQSSLDTKPSRNVTPTEYVLHRPHSDTFSISSTGSDLDLHQRFENIVTLNQNVGEDVDNSLEVIRITTKKKKKKKPSAKSGSLNKDDDERGRRSSSTISEPIFESENVNNKKEIFIPPNVVNNHLPSSEQTSTASLSLIKSVSSSISSSIKDVFSSSNRKSSSTSIENVEIEPAITSPNSEQFESKLVPYEEEINVPKLNIPKLDSGIDMPDITLEKVSPVETKLGVGDTNTMVKDESDVNVLNSSKKNETNSDTMNNLPLEKGSSLSLIERKIAEICSDSPENKSSGEISGDFESETKTDIPLQDVTDASHLRTVSVTKVTQSFHQNSLPNIIDKISCPPVNKQKNHGCENDKSSIKYYNISTDSEDEEDFYSYKSTIIDKTHDSSTKTFSKTRLQESSHLKDYMDCVLKPTNDSSNAESDFSCIDESYDMSASSTSDYSLKLDNNTQLQVMLEIFKQEDEAFVKMFACRDKHTEGHFTVTFVLISDQYLYLLHYDMRSRRFSIQSVTKLTDIIFISTGLFDQTLNIESRDKGRQKQRLWLTPGHQELTKAIVQSLTEVVKAANAHITSVRSRFSVGSDVPLQKIGLRKYISKELHCEAQDVIIHDYSLVFWDDPSSSKSDLPDAKNKEGTLLLRVQDANKGFIWKPVHVVLSGSMLSVSSSKSSPRPLSYLGLGGDQCIGCRLQEVGERSHCVELVLAHGVSWYLSAASANEILDWRKALLLAVSRGVEEVGQLSGCIPCCCIIARNQLFLCHEDLDTKFFRTLGGAQLEDVTGVSIDSEEPTYCIVEFESQEVGVDSCKWVFHFASSADANRFIMSLSSCWREMFKVELPILPLDDVSLLRHCQSYAEQLRKPFEIR